MRLEAMREGGDTVCRMRAARGHSQEAFAQEAGLNKACMGGLERGQRKVRVVNLYRIIESRARACLGCSPR